MGEVYRARDTKLQREVAIKILPASFALDAERLSRFTREAQVLASLNHPHIAAIHGFEAVGDTRFLVLELVEGDTLARRLSRERSGLPFNEALAIARQIADALQAAHDKGIVHRDLKPANIALTSDDQVKVLDFGLAKYEATQAGESSEQAAHSPTLTFAATQAGVVLGTAAYMSPEQAKGRAADKRSDIWGFGCVLFEMLSGRRAFEGDEASDTLASVLKGEPDWAALPADVSPSVRTLLKRCLEKDRRQRIADIAVASFVLSDAGLMTGAAATTSQPASSVRSGRVAAIVAVTALGAAAVGAVTMRLLTPRQAPRLTRLAIAPPTSATPIVNGGDRDLAISPDGSRVAYVGGNGGQVFVRSLEHLDATPLTGLGAANGLFFSPDGQWIGFFNLNATLKKVAVTGGPPVVVCDLAGALPRGGTWGADGTIVFATNGPSGLMKVAASGGSPVALTTPNRAQGEGDHQWPEFLPGGRAVLFTITSAGGELDNSQVAVLDLRSGQQKILVRGGSHAHYLPSGHLVYDAGGTLRAVAFDADRLDVGSAPPVPVLSQVSTTSSGGGDFDVAQNGTLVYIPGGIQTVSRTLVWVDRQGREEPITKAPPRAYLYPRLSPDGTRVALDIRDQDNDIWVWDIARETLTRVTTDPALDRFPVWMPNGRQIVFGSDRGGAGTPGIYLQALDGSGAVERLVEGRGLGLFPLSVSQDGAKIVLRADLATGGPVNRDLMILTMDKRAIQPLIATPFVEHNGMIAPDGRWLVYESNETGQFEIYVRPFPNVNGGRWQISTAGGIQPLWARSGQELFFLSPLGEVMSVAVGRGATWSAGSPVKLFGGRYYAGSGWPANAAAHTYDVSLDGRRFLMIKPAGVGPDQPTGAPNLIVVQNWLEEVRRLVPGR